VKGENAGERGVKIQEEEGNGKKINRKELKCILEVVKVGTFGNW